ncbi:MAG: hypothetical protein A2664_04360 [Candidatus Taylorbacteria bacterium RIFCSPHIGHO2_01_FULL_46_22b]|uniref:Dephospho-CoA kinase n=1 Tax=Candidatus Taylorbacteria bacterium RIFCSPHIGHO2_01_FULL_46_22b TaxID=1802301 RepID=A0A1G2M1N3_9BACT|nr:MAG: hypothetical protein A2664_04360 [Candidatus Taylorbacteria bacterium RIFCSPHIGHO2_01_FULL_46_22b]
MILLGITGHPSAGKDTVADYLVHQHGFIFVSTSDMIRDEIKHRSLGEPTRDLMHTVVNELRAEKGPDVLVKRSVEKFKDAPRLCLGGIRAIGEAQTIQTLGGSIVVVTAPLEIRFARMQARGRTGDGATLEEFKEKEEKETANAKPEAQNVSGIIAMADYTISNEGDRTKLETQLDAMMTELVGKAL